MFATGLRLGQVTFGIFMVDVWNPYEQWIDDHVLLWKHRPRFDYGAYGKP
jgi:hypothetical protein